MAPLQQTVRSASYKYARTENHAFGPQTAVGWCYVLSSDGRPHDTAGADVQSGHRLQTSRARYQQVLAWNMKWKAVSLYKQYIWFFKENFQYIPEIMAKYTMSQKVCTLFFCTTSQNTHRFFEFCLLSCFPLKLKPGDHRRSQHTRNTSACKILMLENNGSVRSAILISYWKTNSPESWLKTGNCKFT